MDPYAERAYQKLGDALKDLERRVVKLEAYMRAARDERRLVSHKNDPGV